MVFTAPWCKARENPRDKRERIANGARHHKMCRDNKKIINSLFSIIQVYSTIVA